MCPECIAATTLMVVGVVSTGGVSALIAKTFGAKKPAARGGEQDSNSDELNTRRREHGNK